MTRAHPDPMAVMVGANDRLLKALITLLAIKDEHLMDELGAVFFVARRDGSPIGKADEATWAHIQAQLALIADLLASGHDEATEAPPPAKVLAG